MALGPSSLTRPMLDQSAAPAAEDIDPLGARLLNLLAEGARRRVARMLLRGATCNGEQAEALGLAENLITHHIRQLREAGLVRERRDARDGRRVSSTLDPEALEDAWRARDGAFGPAALGTPTASCGPTRPRGREDDRRD